MDIISIVGARPQFIKLAPFRAAAVAAGHRIRVLHTGQHYDDNMSATFFRQLELPKADLNLGVGSASHAVQTARMLEGIEADILEQAPDWVVVFGDTNSTLAGALAAAKTGVPAAHVEAGIRSFNRTMPEELNRIVADHICDLLFVPSDHGMVNLKREGLSQRTVRTDDIMTDTLQLVRPRLSERALEQAGVEAGEYYLLTLHRPASVDDPVMLHWMLAQVAALERPVLFPVHPRTRQAMESAGLEPSGLVQLSPPLGYLEFQALQASARGVITDSGGIQKEAYLWEVPCFTLSTETGWTETVETGWNTLVIPRKDDLEKTVSAWLRPTEHPALYGNGHAAEAMVRELEKWLEA